MPAARRNEEIQRRVEGWLDLGHGACVLRDGPCRKTVCDALRYFAGERYELGCYAVMPNHVHVVVRPLEPWVRQLSKLSHNQDTPLARILHSWKRYTSLEINKRLGRRGSFWQSESYDRIVRDEEPLWRVIHYIGANPGKAKLTPGGRVWFNPEWEKLGWGWNP